MERKAILYHRVSTLEQNPTLPLTELREAAWKYEAIEVTETGTGAANDRPGLLRVLDLARKPEVEAVYVWKLDRFGRSALDLLANIRLLVDDYAVTFHAVSQGLVIRPDGDAVSRLLLTVLAAVAEFERDLIRERTVLGVAKARERGKRLGRPPVVDIELAKAVEHKRRMGHAWKRVARDLGVSSASVRRSLGLLRMGVPD